MSQPIPTSGGTYTLNEGTQVLTQVTPPTTTPPHVPPPAPVLIVDEGEPLIVDEFNF